MEENNENKFEEQHENTNVDTDENQNEVQPENINLEKKKKVNIRKIIDIIILIVWIFTVFTFIRLYYSKHVIVNCNRCPVTNNSNSNYYNDNDDDDKEDENDSEESEDKKADTPAETPVVKGKLCTFEYTMDEYNKLKDKNSMGDKECWAYKAIISDVVIDNKKVDVVIVKSNAGEDIVKEENTGVFINGIRYEKLVTGYISYVKNLRIYDDMLLVHVDGGSYVNGYTNVLAFDKDGKELYNFKNALEKEQIQDPNAYPNDASYQHTKIVSASNISRSTFKLNDGSIEFKTATKDTDCMDKPCGSKYIIKFSHNHFEKPIYIGSWSMGN